MQQFKTQSQTKRAFLASFDLILAVVIILSLFLPAIQYSSYRSSLALSQSKDTQTLSLLIQESEYLYSHGAAAHAQIQSPSSPVPKNFTLIGRFNQDSFSQYSAGAGERKIMLGFSSLAYGANSFLPPNKNAQTCIWRKMLDGKNEIIPVWVCAS